MAKQVLDLYELYNLVVARGGLVDVINKKLWQEIIKGLHLPSSITSAAFTLRTQYVSCLFFLSSSSSIFRSGVSRWSSANAKKPARGPFPTSLIGSILTDQWEARESCPFLP